MCDRINQDVGEDKIILIVCNCAIDYLGRSRSTIGLGHRMILIKPDSTLLVHSLMGFKPVNWMTPPNDITAQSEGEGGKTMIYSQRTKNPFEEMKIFVEDLMDYNSYTDLSDTEKIKITHTEKDMQRHLKENPSLIHPDFRLKTTEYQSPMGYFDLYGKIKDKYAVIELKSERVGLPAALQIMRYRNWLNEQLNQDAVGILIAPGITPNARLLLVKEDIEFKKFDMNTIKYRSERKQTLDKWVTE